MEELFTRIFHDLGNRVSGPMSLRVYMQPMMASIFAIFSGVGDAKRGFRPYFWTLFAEDADHKEILLDGWKSVGRIFILAVTLDVIYQLIEFNWVYPLEVLIVAILLAILPYVVIRGLTNRVASHFIKKEPASQNSEK